MIKQFGERAILAAAATAAFAWGAATLVHAADLTPDQWAEEQLQLSDGDDFNAIEHEFDPAKSQPSEARAATPVSAADLKRDQWSEEQLQLTDGADYNAVEHEFDPAKSQAVASRNQGGIKQKSL